MDLLIAYRLEVEATQCEDVENVLVEWVPYGSAGLHLISLEPLSLTLSGDTAPIETSDRFNELRSNGYFNDDDNEVEA